MKRHPSLIPLSRFHRSCLFLALVAKENAPEVKGYPTDIRGKIAYAVSFYKGPLKSHFREEERLWDYAVSKSSKLKSIVVELQNERSELRTKFESLVSEEKASDLFYIGQLLEQHVRKEERVLFQQIQKELTEEELSQIPVVIND